MATFSVTLHGKRVECTPALMESLRAASMQAFERSSPVGEEIAGILFGRRSAAGWEIAEWQPIPRAEAMKPAVPLSEAEEAAARELLASAGSLQAIGWVHSRTRGMAALSPEDALVCERLFGAAGCLAVILRPSTQRPVAAAFFEVGADESAESSRRGVEVRLGVPMAAAAAPAQERKRSRKAGGVVHREVLAHFHRPARDNRSWIVWTLAFLAGVAAAALACFLLIDRPLRLEAASDGERVLVTWNGSAGLLSGATGAELDVAGDAVELALADLRSGSRMIAAPKGDFKITLRLRGPNADSQRSVLTLLERPR